MKFCFYIILFTSLSFSVNAQNYSLEIELENENDSLVSGIQITVTSPLNNKIIGYTNKNGILKIDHLQNDNYSILIESIKINTIKESIYLTSNLKKKYEVETKINELNEIVLTAKESKGLTSTSIIDQKAMQHLQPSSFTDLLELLPGRSSIDPIFNRTNSIKLRETGIADSQENYTISSLGTSFIVDNIPKNVNANLQYTAGSSLSINSGNNIGASDARRSSVAKGVDMRAISTDQIERVEIVRGIPSVEYGDLTSGLVKIIRKRGQSNLEGRFKADAYSKMLYLGKGIEFKNNLNFNFGVDFLNAKPDPVNDFENYKRITASFRSYKKWDNDKSTIDWNLNLDYTGSIDNEKTDPDNSYALTDSYKSSYNDIAISSTLDWIFKESKFLKSLNFYSGVSQQFDQIKQSKLVQLSSAKAIPNTKEAGESYGVFLQPKYISDLKVDGKPIDLYLKLVGSFDLKWINARAGAEWKYAKNNGDGQVYDPLLPPSEDMNTRTRSYKEIPAIQDLSFFVETNKKFKIEQHQFEFLAGLRSITSPGIDKKYTISNQFYFDPRINFQWKLPNIYINNNPLKIDFTAGYGINTKMPTLNMLYPENTYVDFVQLNYYHDNPAYRRIHLKTYVLDNTNFELKPAVNKKWEIRTDLEHQGTNFSFTYFQERMNSGFRNMKGYNRYTYRKFSTSDIDHSAINQAPNVEDLPSETINELGTYTKQANGSVLNKTGIEFQMSTKRFSIINTRLTVNGAWFKTKYTNSLPVYDRNDKIIINGKPTPYLGLYLNDDGTEGERFNTNIMGDTYIPVLKLEFSTSVQIMWFSSSRSLPKNGIPIAYVDPSGNQYNYDEADKSDPALKWLILNYNDNAFRKYTTPFSMNVNFKVSKVFYENFRVSMFVNRLLNYYKEYNVNGQTLGRRGLTSPYFGMELNIKF
jgi:hypothetical protein